MKGSRSILAAAAVGVFACVFAGGCGPAVNGPRFWWDDQNQKVLENYTLPPLERSASGEGEGARKPQPAAAAAAGEKSSAAGAVAKGRK